MNLLAPTLNQMGFLFSLIAIGYVLMKLRVLPEGASKVLARLENAVFMPGLVLSTFAAQFTADRLAEAGKLFLFGLFVCLVGLPIAILTPRLLSRDSYIRNILTYGLAFSNFGFMGNAVVSALFPGYFLDYLIFTLPFYMVIYVWGVPVLLIPVEGESPTLSGRLKSFANPMLIAMLIGILIGLTGLPLPSFLSSVIETAGSCMSPIAMLLTGVTVAGISLRRTFTTGSIYIASAIRLLVLPLIAIAILALVPLQDNRIVCAVAALAMPLGLNTVVVPSAYGKDTSLAAGMALISHLLSCGTIPLIFYLLTKIVG